MNYNEPENGFYKGSLSAGQSVPHFELKNSENDDFKLSDELEKGKIFLYFYRGVW